jgi:hypothetical protein
MNFDLYYSRFDIGLNFEGVMVPIHGGKSGSSILAHGPM